MVELENKQNEQELKPVSRTTFGRVLIAIALVDAALILYLVAGFLVPSKIHPPNQVTALPSEMYDYSYKTSPVEAPPPQPRRVKAEIPLITARGEHPTFVPVQQDGALRLSDPDAMSASVADSSYSIGKADVKSF